ncbi:molecular chaperone HtpG [bacterium]|nr:molecular chaperone HtpG [bacterium]
MSTENTESRESRKPEKRKFKAEVKQVLDIVINSLYTHREIFIRELISNASDALEKMRHEALLHDTYTDKEAPYEIRIETDKDNHTFTITDTGVGMTHEELTANLGTIARSGTREFLESVENRKELESEIIGKFGVGFYSAFMVAGEVRVRTRSYEPEAGGYEWVSNGVGEYTIEEADSLPRGTSVILTLKDDAREYEDETIIKNTITKYSNFVPFPILLKGEKVNTVQAIWLKSPSEVGDEEYNGFFKFISNSAEEPLSRLHITSDAPIQFSALLYIPAMNFEHFGLFKTKPSINLYCRKILIEQHTDKLLPDYFRFINGVVDSADLPLNISRETLQDNMIFRKLGKYLTRRIIRHFEDEAKNNLKKYLEIWDKFDMYIKEGIVADYENRKELASLLRFHSSTGGKDDYISLADYAGRMKEGQDSIYYLNGRSREEIENGPYIGAFRKRDIEVLYLFQPVDDFVLTALVDYEGKKLVSADSADIKLPEAKTAEQEREEKPALSPDEIKGLAVWMKETIGDSVSDVRESLRFMDRPAIIVNPDDAMTTTMRRVMKAAGRDMETGGEKILEINTRHPLIVRLKKLREGKSDKGFLQSCVRQIFDNALAEAGLLDNPKTMVDRVYDIMDRALRDEEQKQH